MKRYIYILFMALTSISILTSCQPEEFGSGNGLAETDMDASFTITQTDAAGNYYKLETAGAENIWYHKWDLGNGTSFRGGLLEDVFIPDAGTYTVTHTVYGKGGSAITSAKEVVVPTSDPAAGNLVKGGRFENADDHNQWTILHISAADAAWTLNQGSATINAINSNQQGIFQAIEVEANKPYKLNMSVSGSGATDTWFEVFASPNQPSQGNDYGSSGEIRMGLNTWTGCGKSPFNGSLSTLSCVGSGNTITFDTSGVIYLVIKCGGGNTGTTGITIDNVELRGVPQE